MSEAILLLHPSDQPVFRLLVDVRGCACEVRLNDVPVWSNTGGLAARAVLSVNEWLFSGGNDITFNLTAPPGIEAGPGTAAVLPEAAAVSTALLYKRSRAPWLAMQELCPVSYRHRDDFKNAGLLNPHPDIPVPVEPTAPAAAAEEPPSESEGAPAPAPAAPNIIHPGEMAALPVTRIPCDWNENRTGIRFGLTVILPAAWPLCPWARALDLTAMPGLDYTAGRLVRSVSDSLQRRDWPGLRRLFADRRAALQSAYYLNEAAVDEALVFPALLKAPETKAVPLDPQAVRAQVCGGGRLIRAVTGEQNAPAITLLCPTLGCQADIETLWLNTGHEWRLAR